MKNTKHTPTEEIKIPLKVGGIMNINGDHMRRIDEADGMVVAFVTDQNLIESEAVKVRDVIAEKIVRAVNSHEALKGTLERVNSMIQRMVPKEEIQNFVLDTLAKVEGRPTDSEIRDRVEEDNPEGIAQAEGR